NSGGSSSEVLSITVNDAVPVISYSGSPFSFLRGQLVSPQYATSTGGTPVTCTASPQLPAGLTLLSDCTLSGTPINTLAPATHSITATNSGGSSSTLITLQVDEPLPVISYTASPFSFTRLVSVGTLTVTNTGGSITGCAATPSLPAGLSLSSSCSITGSPSALQTTQVYAITASNSYGTASTTISIAVADTAPAITFNGGPFLYTRDQIISALSPLNTGGTITSCVVNPQLPTGLSINSSCVISGTPSSISALSAYTVIASNSGGSSSTVISIEILSPTPNVPNIFLNWISLSALNGSWNGSPSTEGRVWRARIDGSSVVLDSALSVGWDAKDLVQAPRLAPNGSYWIAVSTRALSGNSADPTLPCSNIWKVSPDGSQWTHLTANTTAGIDSLDPAISPDSSTIAFASMQPVTGTSSSFNIWTISSSGASATAITQENNPNRDSREPAFSPSGSTLVFSSLKRVNNKNTSSYNLWKYTSSNNTLAAFSTDTAAGYDRRQPRYSNDGAQLVYSSTRPLNTGGSSTPSTNIWISSASSLTETAITTTTTSGHDAWAPEFSVSDQYIAFEGYLSISGLTPQSSNIWVYDTVSSSMTPITKNTAANLDSKLMPGSTW
ncbi:hypothetical protein EBZ37_08415, partial [bacterium]|nr:hypothetical protein [bacterium]